jgi:hypothetical protein
MTAPSSFGGGLLVFAACAAASAFAWPYIRDHSGPDMTPYTNADPYDRASAGRGGYSPSFPGARNAGGGGKYRMHLDPDATPGQVEDRRGERGPDIAAGDGDQDGRDMGRLGPPPTTDGRGPGRTGCRDTWTGRDVPMSFCDREARERMGRRR